MEWSATSLAHECAAFHEILGLIGENPTAGKWLALRSPVDCKPTIVLAIIQSYAGATHAGYAMGSEGLSPTEVPKVDSASLFCISDCRNRTHFSALEMNPGRSPR